MDKKTKKVITQPKAVYEILEELTETGLSQHQRRGRVLFLSSFSAGLEIGFSVLLMGVLYTLYAAQVSPSALHLLLSAAYPVGFLFVVIGRSELFTEHTTMAVLPVLGRKEPFMSLLRIWGIVLAGNLLGGYIFSGVLTTLPVKMEIITESTFEKLAADIIRYNWKWILGSATLAGWLMGLLAWLVTSAQETISRIFIVVLITFVIGIAGLHHSIVGSIEVFCGYLTGTSITLGDYLSFESLSILGNIIGGSVFVSILKYGHTRRENQQE